LMLSASATDDPPYFCTMRATSAPSVASPGLARMHRHGPYDDAETGRFVRQPSL